MNEQQFATYHENLLQSNEDRKASAALIDRRNVVEKVTAKLLKQTTLLMVVRMFLREHGSMTWTLHIRVLAISIS